MTSDIHPQELTARFPDADRTGFGDGPELSAHLLDLIRTGRKTATCGAFDPDGDPVPRPGDICIADDWDGQPALAYRVTHAEVLRFDEVSEDFALAEGEGDHAQWRAAHEAFFARTCGFDPAMKVVCERFELIATADDLKG